ncbi:hypothetical protein [Streptomyces canus]|uniref:hypothetical protein n=1 Tax=Streptomyces canus TaxID=58343 RepID=UPI002E299917|nr:hypothetical protein [Streptomyces canus]
MRRGHRGHLDDSRPGNHTHPALVFRPLTEAPDVPPAPAQIAPAHEILAAG